MKYIINSILLSLVSIFSLNANTISFSPTTQSVTVNSGELIEVEVQLNCTGSQPGASTFFINPIQIPDNGYIIHDPGTGAMYVGDVETVVFEFQRTVSATTTTEYIFRADWSDEAGNAFVVNLTINVTYEFVDMPDPDADGDGIPDAEDDCPNQAGPSSNNGCPLTCDLPMPANRITVNISSFSAQARWDFDPLNDGYQLQYKPTSSGNGNWVTVNLSSILSFYTMLNLAPLTEYEWRIRIRCDNGTYGEWSPSSIFTTLELSCDLLAPDNTLTQNITSSIAEATWDIIPSSGGYQLQYKISNSSTWTTVDISNGSIDQYTLTGLVSLTIYQWRIRTRCVNGLYGNWSDINSFATNCIEDLFFVAFIAPGTISSEQADNTITSYSTINSGATIEYIAGTQISLKASSLEPFLLNFHAMAGSTFNARIEDCPGGFPLGFVQKDKPLTSNEGLQEDTIDESNMIIEQDAPVLQSNSQLKLYPNPARGQVNLESSKMVRQLELYDQLGRSYKSQTVNAYKAFLNIEELPKGIYFLRISFEDGQLVTKRIVKSE